MNVRISFVIVALLFTATAHAQIYRWDNQQLIPGTEGITPGPGVQLDEWNSETRNLRFGDFSGNLTNANFSASWLDDARFPGANLTGAYLASATLTDANLMGANLTSADLFGSAGTSVARISPARFCLALRWPMPT